jgi:predicted ATPase/Tfp pilus assembly protein PilF
MSSAFRRSAGSRDNVREPPTSFLGRAKELDALTRWFDSGDRLVTLLGPAGCGKTRLAKRFAALHAGDFTSAGGTWFCELTDALDASEVVASVARTLGVSFQSGADETPIALFGRVLAEEGPILLVLDNCEQAAQAVAHAVASWREAAPQARILVTSRERLGVAGERACDLGPLPLPQSGQDAASSEAVQLFVERARLVRPEYAPLGDEAQVVASIVRALDGIPLAIELAASRMRLMSASTLAARLNKRFELLTSTEREAPLRQRTLRAAIDWSWGLLEPSEQATLRQCAVFRGGFTLEAAEAIVDLTGVGGATTVLETVQRLRDKSLVYAEPTRDFPSELRLGLYESIREYAAQRLAESTEGEAAAHRHTSYFLSVGAEWAEHAERGLVEDARRLDAEMENVAAVHARALGRSRPDALRAAIVLDAILGRSGSLQARSEMLERATSIARDGIEPALLSEVLLRRGWARLRAGATEQARADAEESLREARNAGDRTRAADAHLLRARIEMHTGGDATSHVEAALADARATNDRAREARALQVSACVLLNRGDHALGHDAFSRVIAMANAAGDHAIAAYALGNLGTVLIQQGRLAEAQEALEQSTAALYAMGDTQSYFIHLFNLGTVRHERGDLERAERDYRQVTAAAERAGWNTVQGMALAALGVLRAAAGEVVEAGRLFDMAEASSASAGERRAAVVRVHRGHLDLALARECTKGGDESGAEAHRAAAARALSEGTQFDDTTDDLLTALRWLGRALDAEGKVHFPRNTWVVSEDGSWFRRPNGWRIDVGDRQHARAALRALLRARQDSPGRSLSTDDVLREAWPGERVRKRAGAMRVYVTISTLRDLGLRDLLVNGEGGYRLDPLQSIAVGSAETAAPRHADDADEAHETGRPEPQA